MRILIAVIFCATCVSAATIIDGTDPEMFLKVLLEIDDADSPLQTEIKTRGLIDQYFHSYFTTADAGVNAIVKPSKLLVLLSIDIDDEDRKLKQWVIRNDASFFTSSKDAFNFTLQPPSMTSARLEEIKRKFAVVAVSQFFKKYFVQGISEDDVDPADHVEEDDVEEDDEEDADMKQLASDYFANKQTFEKVFVEARLVYQGVTAANPQEKAHVFVAIAIEY